MCKEFPDMVIEQLEQEGLPISFPDHEPAAKKVNVLLVDDREEDLVALEGVLGALGLNLVRAATGEQALRCLLAREFALIILDVQLPGMDGFQTAELIR